MAQHFHRRFTLGRCGEWPFQAHHPGASGVAFFITMLATIRPAATTRCGLKASRRGPERRRRRRPPRFRSISYRRSRTAGTATPAPAAERARHCRHHDQHGKCAAETVRLLHRRRPDDLRQTISGRPARIKRTQGMMLAMPRPSRLRRPISGEVTLHAQDRDRLTGVQGPTPRRRLTDRRRPGTARPIPAAPQSDAGGGCDPLLPLARHQAPPGVVEGAGIDRHVVVVAAGLVQVDG